MFQNAVKLDNNKKQYLVLFILFVLFFFTIPLYIKSRYTLHIFIMVLYFAFMASAWNIVCGFVGELSLGHSALVGIGGYTSTLLFINCGISPWIGMFIGAVVTTVAGIIIGYPCFRLRGPYFTLTTIAFAELLRVYIENTEVGPFGIPFKGAMGLLVPLHGNAPGLFEFKSKVPYYYIILIAVFLSTLITYIIKNKKLGYYLVAIKSDPDAAESLGVNITKFKLLAMAISAAIISFGGTFYAQYFRYIGPTRIFGNELSVQIALIALIGGRGTVLGPIFGAFLLVPISEFLSAKFGGNLPGLHLFIYGLVMMLVVLYLPQGIHDPVVNLIKKLKVKVFGSFKSKQKTAV